MSWFGSGGNDKAKGDSDSSYNPAQTYDSPVDNFAGSSLGSSGAPSGIEQEFLLEQQKMLVQAVMFKLTESAFQKCVTSPSSSLSSTESSCIKAVVTKYLDTSELILKRLSQAGSN